MLQLDSQQTEIVNSKAQNIVVVAGAGSGKTRVLTERIKHLIQVGVPASDIVAITFTNMAAEEMRARLKSVPQIGDAFVGTIHSFANRIYKNSGIRYELLTDETEHLIFEELLNKPKYAALTLKRWLMYKDLEKLVEMGKKDECFLQDFLTPSEKNVLYKCEEDKFAIMRRDNIITFDELIDYAGAYYKSIGAIIDHVLVDELQDIGTAEYKFIRNLKASCYFFVGDDWQAIYGFKGGNVEIFKNLVMDSTFTTYYLTNNYRNARAIIKLGEQIISQIPDRLDKTTNIISTIEGTITCQTKTWPERIIALLDKDRTRLCDWFVLTRSNKEAYELADLLDDNGLDYCFIRKSDLTLDELQEAMLKNQVKIMTVHSSKGLESKKVILYGNFPIMQPTYLRNLDERKVMYVGVTRAKEELHIFN